MKKVFAVEHLTMTGDNSSIEGIIALYSNEIAAQKRADHEQKKWNPSYKKFTIKPVELLEQ